MSISLQQWERLISKASRDVLPMKIKQAMIKGALIAEAESTLSVSGRVLKVRSGFLRNNIRSFVKAGPRLNHAIHLKSIANYSSYHEHGTSRMRARPFIKPAIEHTRKQMPALLIRAIRESLSHA